MKFVLLHDYPKKYGQIFNDIEQTLEQSKAEAEEAEQTHNSESK